MSLSKIFVNNIQIAEVDNEPSLGSHNLVESGGVVDAISEVHSYDILDADFVISDNQNNNIVEFSDGQIRTKNFNSKNVANKDDIDLKTVNVSDFDLTLSDENAYNIVQFKDGHIKTKNFDSKDTITEDKLIAESRNIENSDLEINDSENNCIVSLNSGHIKTKNFDSKDVMSHIESMDVKFGEYYKNIFKINLYTLDDVDSVWELVDGKYISNSGKFGWENKLVVKKENTISDKVWLFDFSADGNGIFYFGSCGSTYGTTNGKQSLFSVNFVNETINIHNYIAAPFESIPAVAISKNVTLSLNKKYRVVLSRKNRIMKLVLYDITTTQELVDFIYIGVSSSYGLMYDMPCCFSTDSAMKLYNIEVNIPISKPCSLIIEGDSITAAWVTEESQGYGELIASACKGLCVKISGRGNGGIRNLIESQNPVVGRLAAEVNPLKPDYTMITIGTNDYSMVSGGSFKTYLGYLVDYVCGVIGSNLILNHIPMNERTGGASVINDIIDEVLSEKSQYNIRCIRFDVCTAINYDPSQGIDTSLFADAAHPNALGYIRMFEQAKIDVPELFYNN